MLISCLALELIYNVDILSIKSVIDDWKEIHWRRILVLVLSLTIVIALRMQMGTPTFHLEDNPIAVIEDRVFRAINHVFLHSINAWLLICPDWLSFDWSMGCLSIIRSWNDIRLLGVFIHLGILFSIALIITCIINSRRRRKQIAALFILTIVPFLPASGLIHVGFVIAERLLYMPSIGWCLVIGLGFRRLLFKLTKFIYLQATLKVLFIVIVFIYVLKTRTRASQWNDGLTLYQSALRVCPNNSKVHYNIASKQADKELAILHYRRAIELFPANDGALMNLGNVYRDRGDLDQAEHYLRRALITIKIM